MNGQARSFTSGLVQDLSMSAIKEMAMRAAKVEGVASLAWGLPSFQTPGHIRAAVSAAIASDEDAGKYTLPDGLPEFREAVAQAHFESTGATVAPDREIIVTAGNMEGIKALLGTILEPGGEIIVTDPGFASHLQQIRLCGGVPVCWPMDESQRWALDIEGLEALITERTRAILLVSPSNPTGRVFSREELLRLGQVVRDRSLLLIVDDPYSHFTYENSDRYFNLASVPEMTDYLAYLFTFSKCHAMSGWRLGYAIVPEELKRQMLKVHDAMLICAPRISQIAGLAALRSEPIHLAEFKSILDRRRSLICDRLDRVPHVFSYVRPEGAYYVFPRIQAQHDSARQFALDMLSNCGVCVTPGDAFGPSGGSHVRMAFCGGEDEINRAFDRIEAAYPA